MHTLSFLMHHPDPNLDGEIDPKAFVGLKPSPSFSDYIPDFILNQTTFFWIVAAFIAFLFLALVRLIYRVYRRFTRDADILELPTEFAWLTMLRKSGSLTQSTDGFVTYQHRKMPQKAEWWHEHVPRWGRKRLEEVLGRYFGSRPGGVPHVTIPDDVVTISIPRRHFRCGAECTEFEVRDGQDGFWSYQMLCHGVQITLFHVEQHSFIAGVCIYLEDPTSPLKMKMRRIEWALSKARGTYTPDPAKLKTKRIEKKWCERRHEWIVITRNQFGEIDKFAFDGKENSLEPIQCFDCRLTPQEGDEKVLTRFQQLSHTILQHRDPRIPQDCLDWVKVEFCEKRKKPQMLSLNADGVVQHLHWNGHTRKFRTEKCKSCQRTAAALFEVHEETEDSPPSYEYLELIEVDETQPNDQVTAFI